MSQSRIDALVAMAQQQPEEPLIWYGLANEYDKLGNWSEMVDALRRVIRLNPDYASAYQLLGTALINQGSTEEARRTWSQGIDAARRMGAWKAQQHLENLLAGTSRDAAGTDLCLK